MNRDNLIAAIKALRETGKEQTYGDCYEEGCYCALGVIGSEILGLDNKYLEKTISYSVFDRYFGSPEVADCVWKLNDSGLSFSEVADKLGEEYL